MYTFAIRKGKNWRHAQNVGNRKLKFITIFQRRKKKLYTQKWQFKVKTSLSLQFQWQCPRVKWLVTQNAFANISMLDPLDHNWKIQFELENNSGLLSRFTVAKTAACEVSLSFLMPWCQGLPQSLKSALITKQLNLTLSNLLFNTDYSKLTTTKMST